MGTSTNQGSSRTAPSWTAVRAVLGQSRVPVELQSREIWRAAAADPEASVEGSLSDPFLALAARIAAGASSPIEAAEQFDNEVADAGAAGLMLDLGKRALMRAVAERQGAQGFVAELFAEAASYYVSRDLPSIIGAPGRIATSTQAIELKRRFQEIARTAASAGARALSATLRADAEPWTRVVGVVLDDLQHRERK
jgi:hypothetical protein